MDFKDLVAKRESTRRYSSREIEPEKIQIILEACRLAPSACNSQPWKIIMVTRPDLVSEIAQTTYGPALRFNKFVSEAPAIAVIVAEPPSWLSKIGSAVKDKNLALMDIGMVAEHFCLQAADLGLGSCMLGWFDEKKAKALLGVPSSRRIQLMIALGYPSNEKPRMKIRKSIQQMSSFNHY